MTEPALPLFDWRDNRHRHTIQRRRRIVLAVLGALAIGALAGPSLAPPPPLLVWNASASAPLGLYAVRPGAPPAIGDMVIVRLPPAARALAAHRRYLPADVPAVKRIAAGPGDRICAIAATITIDGRSVARRLVTDRLGRRLPWWHGCHRLAAGELFLLMTESPTSFDGRYFGVSRTSDVIGRAVLLWSR